MKSLNSVSCVAALLVVACLPGGSPTGKLASQVVGAQGGTVSAQGGVRIDVPPEALSEEVEITITGLGEIEPPKGTSALGGGYLFEPEDTWFSVPVKVTLPVEGPLPADAKVMVGRQHDEGGAWELLEGALDDTSITVETQSFSRWVAVLVDPNAGDAFRSAEHVSWTRQFGRNVADEVSALAVAADDSVVVAGLTYGAFEGYEQGGNGDAFVRKYDGEGNALWTRQFGHGSTEHAEAITTNAAGTIFVAGVALHLLDEDDDFSRAGGAFVRAYGSGGDLKWSFQLEKVGSIGSGRSRIDAIAVSGEDLVIVGSEGSSDMFVRKLDAGGQILWGDVLDAQEGEWANSYDSGCGVALDGEGAVFALGQLNGALAGHSTQGGVVVRKYDTAGTTLWTQTFADDGCSDGGSILVDDDVVYAVTRGGVRKLDADGALLWEKKVFPLGFSTGALSETGDVIVAGYTRDIPPAEGDSWDIVVRRYDAQGEERWTRQVGSPGHDDPFAFGIDSADRLYLGGRSLSPPGTLTGLQGPEGSGAFLMQLEP